MGIGLGEVGKGGVGRMESGGLEGLGQVAKAAHVDVGVER